jgi:hypothetical protein
VDTIRAIIRSWIDSWTKDDDPARGVNYQPNRNSWHFSGPENRYVEIRKVPTGWEVHFGAPLNQAFPHLYLKTEEARKASMMWVFQGLWDPP